MAVSEMTGREKVCVISLGCAKNLVDSEHILGWLAEGDYPLVAGLEEADIAVINTCGFIRPAVEEAVRTILEAAERKKKGQIKKLFVVGCFVQRYGYKLRRELPEVDGWAGTGQIHRITELLEISRVNLSPFFINRPTFLADHHTPRVQSTPPFTAYLKIAEGCSQRCRFCIIPQLRGPFRSRSLESLIEEAVEMAERGVQEVNLIAQDTTMYGKDLGEGYCLEKLLERLMLIAKIPWIRVLYSHPERVTDRLLELMEAPSSLCPYLDIPIQHVHPGILRAMGRGLDERGLWKRIERIRSRNTRISLRTTVMVGFPGETETAFKRLLAFVKKAEFDHLGAFVFTPEKGTAAAQMSHQVDPRVAQRRRDQVMRVQAEISRKNNKGKIGQILSVLIEGSEPGKGTWTVGRAAEMAPEVDGQVLITGSPSGVGAMVPVRITGAKTYDLIGEWA